VSGRKEVATPPGGRALLSWLRGAGPAYSAARQRLDLVYEVLEAEPGALPLAGGSVNALVGNYQARGAPPRAPQGSVGAFLLGGTVRSARNPQGWIGSDEAPLPSSHRTFGRYADTGICVR
jgi:hypothetical protein